MVVVLNVGHHINKRSMEVLICIEKKGFLESYISVLFYIICSIITSLQLLVQSDGPRFGTGFAENTNMYYPVMQMAKDQMK